jgi:hypothetical protein
MSTDFDLALAAATAALPGLRTDHNSSELRARIWLAAGQDWLCT